MELPTTSFNENSNPKQNLIYSEEPKEQINQEMLNVNQFFVFFKNNKSPENEKFIIKFSSYCILVISLSAFILSGTIGSALTIKNLETEVRIIIISGGIILALISLISFNNKLEIIKDKANNKTIIKLKNFLCCTKKLIKIDLDNTYFYVKHEIYRDSKGRKRESNILFIINNNKNLSGIDFDKSNIKSKPMKLFYYFNNIDNAKGDKFGDDLNNFVGASGDNPLTFNINNYMNNKNINFKPFFEGGILSRYMKFSDNYFTYHLRDPFSTTRINCLFIFFTILLNVIFIGLGIYSIKSGIIHIELIVIGSLLFVIYNIILYLIYKCVKEKKENIYRIDIIYSRNFDRMFIGLVKYTKTSYVNIFEFQMNNINRFILEKISHDNFNLKVIFKNNHSKLICNVKKSQEELEGLAFLLNERLINNINNTNEIETIDNNNNVQK